MINRKLTLVEDAQHFYKWSSVRWQVCLGALLEVMAWVAAHWLGLQPALAQVFHGVTPDQWAVWGNLLLQVAPTQDQAHTMAAALGAGVFFRVTSIQPSQASPAPTSPTPANPPA